MSRNPYGPPERPLPAQVRSEDRPIQSQGSYNLNFIDWDNEHEAVLEHHHSLEEQGLDYEDFPYFDLPADTFFVDMEGYEENKGNGLTRKQIAQLRQFKNRTMRTCSICQEGSSDGMQLPWGHVFHTSCISSWLEQKAMCPNCRQPVKP